MNISISERENTREINVLGELDKSDDIHHLLAALTSELINPFTSSAF